MPVGEGFDIDDDLLAHFITPLDRGRAHMRQENDVRQADQVRIDRGFAFEHVEARPGELAGLQCLGQCGFVDHFAARGVYDERFWLHQFQPPGIEQVERGWRMRAVDGDDVHPLQLGLESSNLCLQFLLLLLLLLNEDLRLDLGPLEVLFKLFHRFQRRGMLHLELFVLLVGLGELLLRILDNLISSFLDRFLSPLFLVPQRLCFCEDKGQ